MRVGEAYDKVLEELTASVKSELGDSIPEDLEAIGVKEFQALSKATKVLEHYAYGGSVKEFIYSRSSKIASEFLAGLPNDNIEDAFSAALDNDVLFDRWLPSLLQVFAMGYSFADPEHREVSRDKEGFLKLCREVDRDVIEIQVARFAADAELRERINQRFQTAGAFTSHMFAVLRKPVTRAIIREWVEKVYGTVCFDCFAVGQGVRALLEQEAAFEAMMNKETD